MVPTVYVISINNLPLPVWTIVILNSLLLDGFIILVISFTSVFIYIYNIIVVTIYSICTI